MTISLLFVLRRLIKSMLHAVPSNSLVRKIAWLFIMPFLHPNFNYCNTVRYFCSNRSLYIYINWKIFINRPVG